MMQGNLLVVLALDAYIAGILSHIPFLKDYVWIRHTFFYGGLCALGV
jgi:hypothetical protein